MSGRDGLGLGLGGDWGKGMGEFGNAPEMAALCRDEIFDLRVVLSGCCILACTLE